MVAPLINIDDLTEIYWDKRTDNCVWFEGDAIHKSTMSKLEAGHPRLRQMLMYLTTDSKAVGSDSSKAVAHAAMVKRYMRCAPPDPGEQVWLKNDIQPWSTWVDIDESKNKLSYHLVFIEKSIQQRYSLGKTRMEATNPGVMKVIGMGDDVGLTGPDMVKWIKESMAPAGLTASVPLSADLGA